MDFAKQYGATSALGAMRTSFRGPVLVGCILAGLGTSTAHADPNAEPVRTRNTARQTNAGKSVESAGAATALSELRRRSGLTWDQLARLFDVNRRSLHFWASGKAMSASNEEHLQRLLGVVREIDRGSAARNRSALLELQADGAIALDLLRVRQYDRVISLLGIAAERRPPSRRVSADVLAQRAPRPPEELVEALNDRPHRDVAHGRAARSVKVRGGR
jgi:DNA-binding transcriptional regulator YiaG